MTETAEKWVSEYDADTGEHRIYEDGELIACVGNIDMDFNRQEELAELICRSPEPRDLSAYRAQIRAEALEEAALYCETHNMGINPRKKGYIPDAFDPSSRGTHSGMGYAASIRAMKEGAGGTTTWEQRHGWDEHD